MAGQWELRDDWSHKMNGLHVCEYVESPPVPGESRIAWACKACRIGFVAAVKRGVFPQDRARHLGRAKKAYDRWGEPWVAEVVGLLAEAS